MAIIIFTLTFCVMDIALNIYGFVKRKKVKKDIQYLETLRDWCASTGMNPDDFLNTIKEVQKANQKFIKENMKK